MDCRTRIASALSAALVAMLVSPLHAETIDRVLAVVGGQIITLSDVTAARDLHIVEPAADPDPVRSVLSQLIDRELMLAEVDRYAPPEPAADAIDRALATVRSRFASQSAYEEVLERSGVDDRHVRELVRQTLRIRSYEDQRFSPTDTRRDALIDEWLAGLRRRGDIVDIYATTR